MILVLLGISLILIGVGFIVYNVAMDEECASPLWIISIFIFIISFIAAIVVSIKVSGLRVLPDQITMYEEENAKIESSITTIVEQYQGYEKDTYEQFKNESATVLVSLYPELKSDTLVAKQIETYLANNEKIKSLKSDLIKGSVYKWWLYFGK